MVVLFRAFLHEHFLFFTYPATQREHSVHPAHLQAHSVDKLRHQESLWREDLQSGGIPRTTTTTGSEPKELATVSRIEAYCGDPYHQYDVQEKFGERDHWAPITKEVNEFGEFGNPASIDSKFSETSYFRSQMHSDDSVESIADSDLEDGELQKMLTSPLYVQKASEETRCNGHAGERGKCTKHSSRPKGKFEVSFIWRSESFGGNPMHCFSSEQGNLIRGPVFRNADPSNLRGSLLEGKKDHFLNQARSDMAKQELMSNLSISASVNHNDKRKSKDWRYRTHNTDLLSPDENMFDYKKKFVYERKSSRNTEIQNMREMGRK